MKTRPVRLLGVLVTLLPVSSCTSSRLTAAWSNPSYTQRPIRSVMVMGIFNRPTSRRLYEDAFCAQLQARQVTAVASYQHLPSDEKPSQEAIERALASSGCETMLVTRVLGSEETTQYVPPPRRDTFRHGSFYDDYDRAFDEVYSPGYYTTFEVYFLQSKLYDRHAETLIWSADSETVNPDNLNRDINDLVRLLIDDLHKKGII